MSRLTEPQDVVRVLDYPFAPLPIWLLAEQNGDVGDGAKVLWGYLRWRQGPHPDCWPSVIRAAADLGVSRVVILRRLAELEKAGYIETRRQPGRVNRYTVFCRPTRECQLSESMAQELHVPGAAVNAEANSRPVSKTILVSETEQTSAANDTTPVSETILDQSLKRDTNYIKEQEKITEKSNENGPEIWKSMLDELVPQMGQNVIATFRTVTRAERVDGHLRVKVSNDYWREKLEDGRLHRTLERLLAERLGDGVKLEFLRGRA